MLGTEVDETQLQPYLKSGRNFDFTRDSGYIAASILSYLPAPMTPGMEVQKHFLLPSASGAEFVYQGFKDLFVRDSKVLPLLAGLDSAPAVVDFKTTSDFKWAKTETTLQSDVQAMVYAMNALFETGARTVDLLWLYMRTRGARKAKPVHIRVSADQVAEQFARIESTGVEIIETRQSSAGCDEEKFPLSLEANSAMCDAYGGCPFRSRCNLSPKEMIDFNRDFRRSDMATTTDLLANLKAKKAAVVKAPAPAAVVETPVFAGVNPPEKDLPPAPAVGVTEAPAPVVVEPKKRGRPKKVAMMAAEPETVEAPTLSAAPALPNGKMVMATWGREILTHNGQTAEFGPFAITDAVAEGESVGDAIRRVDAVLYAFVLESRANRLARMGGAA